MIIKQREYRKKNWEKTKNKEMENLSFNERVNKKWGHLFLDKDKQQEISDGIKRHKQATGKFAEALGMVYCTKCGKIKKKSEFQELCNGKLKRPCKECCKPINKRSQKKYYTPGKRHEIFIRFKEKHMEDGSYHLAIKKRRHKRRALKKGLSETFTLSDITFVFNQFNHKCFKCGSRENLSIDHHYPLSGGNVLSIENAVCLCHKCNTAKKDKDPEQFYTVLEMLDLFISYNKRLGPVGGYRDWET